MDEAEHHLRFQVPVICTPDQVLDLLVLSGAQSAKSEEES
jgi:hypothetical protein